MLAFVWESLFYLPQLACRSPGSVPWTTLFSKSNLSLTVQLKFKTFTSLTVRWATHLRVKIKNPIRTIMHSLYALLTIHITTRSPLKWLKLTLDLKITTARVNAKGMSSEPVFSQSLLRPCSHGVGGRHRPFFEIITWHKWRDHPKM